MASTPVNDPLAGYPVSEGVFDEAFEADGSVRPFARAGLDAVLRADASDLPGAVSRTLRRAGVRFSSVEGDLEFYVDPVPRVITARDWEPEMRGVRPPGNVWIGVAGLDLVRDVDGSWLVLEDNVRTPSGFAYLH